MKTIAEHNKEAEKSTVFIHTFKDTLPEWVPMGIMCPCGCEKELLKDKWPFTLAHGLPIMCPTTKRKGYIIYSDAIRDVIKCVEWD